LPILMMSCAPLWGFLEVTLVLPRDERDVRALVRFAALTSLAFSLVLLAMAATPLRTLLLDGAFALGPHLRAAVVPALALLALEPLVLSARAIAQGLLLRGGHGALVLALSPVKLLVMAVAGFAVARAWPQANGAVVAIGLIVGGDLVDVALYGIATWRTASHRLHAAEAPAENPAEPHLEAA
ncbi:MAG: hypothetical protein IT348_06035, partial [Candidatus Eisenbacteria bacterium]|nr:hypothetical protein [Candidatus Eisenbacteria bacterium]